MGRLWGAPYMGYPKWMIYDDLQKESIPKLMIYAGFREYTERLQALTLSLACDKKKWGPIVSGIGSPYEGGPVEPEVKELMPETHTIGH